MKSKLVAVMMVMFLAVGAAVFAGDAAKAPADTADKEKAAVAAAEAWLKLVDQGKYGESYDEAAELFRNALTKADWEKTIKGVRDPLGKLVSRKASKTTYANELPGAPDGEYVVIEFATSYENKKTAVETVTPMLEKDGKWKVSGYYIK